MKRVGTGRTTDFDLPKPFTGGHVDTVFKFSDLPTSEDLSQYLCAHGVDTSEWGKGNTKEVNKYWKEIQGDEAGLELWVKTSGERCPVRVTHVLRAKVCSPQSKENGVFLFNTWQQYGDGRTRTRNGLLSEKLQMSEMPIEEHLFDVCQRAVTEEEMARVADSLCKIRTGTPAPVYDPNYQCPLQVQDAELIDHTIEVEPSKSYPGLMTVYHLYTVDITCTGLPMVDFNTLEFDHDEDASGLRPLKYIHAWVWLDWRTIQQYLFEGSELKERKSKGDFSSATEFQEWLRQFDDLELQSWGQGGYRSVERLFLELQTEQAHLELWGKAEGVPLLVRVVHAVQLTLTSSGVESDRLLMQVWQHKDDGSVKAIVRPPTSKMSTATLPFDEKRFAEAAEQTVAQSFSYLVDRNCAINDVRRLPKEYLSSTQIRLDGINFLGHRFDLDESPSYKNLNTVYHLYTLRAECSGLPSHDFSSLIFAPEGNGVTVAGWRWMSWPETVDHLHTRTREAEDAKYTSIARLRSSVQQLSKARDAVSAFTPDDIGARSTQIVSKLRKEVGRCKRFSSVDDPSEPTPGLMYPPCTARLEGEPLVKVQECWDSRPEDEDAVRAEAELRSLAVARLAPAQEPPTSFFQWILCRGSCTSSQSARAEERADQARRGAELDP